MASPHIRTVVARPVRKAPELIVHSEKVLAAVAHYPRHNLGSTVYDVLLEDNKSTLLPRFDGRENCIYQVKIPYKFLTREARRNIIERAPIWGTEIYTDDSDIVAALIHDYRIPTVYPEDVDEKMEKMLHDPNAPVHPTLKEFRLMKDIIVDIIILPQLEKYKGTIRNGLKSRTWGGEGCTKHDGMSYMIHDVRIVEKDTAVSGIRLRKKRLDERDMIMRWGNKPLIANGVGERGLKKVEINTPQASTMGKVGA